MEYNISKIIVESVDITEEIHSDILKYNNKRYPNEKLFSDFIKDNERYNLKFIDENEEIVSIQNNQTLPIIEDKFGQYISFKIEELNLAFGETGVIENLNYSDDIDFRNTNNLNTLFKQLFKVDNVFHKKNSQLILSDGTVVQLPEQVSDETFVSITNKHSSLTIKNIMYSGAVLIYRNNIIFSDLINQFQENALKSYLFNKHHLNVFLFKDDKFYKVNFYNTQFHIYDVVSDIVSDFYNDVISGEECLFNDCIKESFLKHSRYQHIDVVTNTKELLFEQINSREKVIHKDVDEIVSMLIEEVVDFFNDYVEKTIGITDVYELNRVNKEYNSSIMFCYKFNRSEKEFKAIGDDKKFHIKNGIIDCGWHPIKFEFVRAGIDSFKMNVKRDSDNAKRKLTDEEFIRYSTDTVNITINVNALTSIDEIVQTFAHEFTHIIQHWGKLSVSKLKTQRGRFANIDKNVFKDIDKSLIQTVWNICYTFEENEQEAMLNELRTYIINNVSKHTIDTSDIEQLKTKIFNESRTSIPTIDDMEEITDYLCSLKLNSKQNILTILVIAFYMNHHRIINVYCPYTNKKFIQDYIDDEVDVDEKKIRWIAQKIIRNLVLTKNEFRDDYSYVIDDVLSEISDKYINVLY